MCRSGNGSLGFVFLWCHPQVSLSRVFPQPIQCHSRKLNLQQFVGMVTPQLVRGAGGNFKRLTTGALEGLALAVNAWYDDRLMPKAG
jgi:hypothetical protein